MSCRMSHCDITHSTVRRIHLYWYTYNLQHCSIITTLHSKLRGIRRVSNPSTSINPSSLKHGFLLLIQMSGFVPDNGTKSNKSWTRGRKPISERLLMQIACVVAYILIYICILIYIYIKSAVVIHIWMRDAVCTNEASNGDWLMLLLLLRKK